MPGRLSHRSRCRKLASRVVAHLVKGNEAEDIELAIARTRAAVEADPAWFLANDPDANLIELLHRERVRRFVERGCRQIGKEAWEAETRQIATDLEVRLAERFRKQLQKMGKN